MPGKKKANPSLRERRIKNNDHLQTLSAFILLNNSAAVQDFSGFLSPNKLFPLILQLRVKTTL